MLMHSINRWEVLRLVHIFFLRFELLLVARYYEIQKRLTRNAKDDYDLRNVFQCVLINLMQR